MKISEIKTIRVEFSSPVRLLENGLIRASDMAIVQFGIDDSGHSSKVKGYYRSSCSVVLKFVGMRMYFGMGGAQYVLSFKAWCEKSDD